MVVIFKTGRLEAYYQDSKKAARDFGLDVAARYVGRINIIKAAKSIEELQKLPGLRCVTPANDRAGEWTVELINFYRLVFTLQGEAIEVTHVKRVGTNYNG